MPINSIRRYTSNVPVSSKILLSLSYKAQSACMCKQQSETQQWIECSDRNIGWRDLWICGYGYVWRTHIDGLQAKTKMSRFLWSEIKFQLIGHETTWLHVCFKVLILILLTYPIVYRQTGAIGFKAWRRLKVVLTKN